jgi:transcription factor E2F7/8
LKVPNSNLVSFKTHKAKSLGALSIIFLQFFVHQMKVKNDKQLLAEDIQLYFSEKVDNGFKSQARRLYDVANVFASLGVIKKIKMDYRKGFEWVGSKGFSVEDEGCRGMDQEGDESSDDDNIR